MTDRRYLVTGETKAQVVVENGRTAQFNVRLGTPADEPHMVDMHFEGPDQPVTWQIGRFMLDEAMRGFSGDPEGDVQFQMFHDVEGGPDGTCDELAMSINYSDSEVTILLKPSGVLDFLFESYEKAPEDDFSSPIERLISNVNESSS